MGVMEPEPRVGRQDLMWKAWGMLLRGVLVLAIIAGIVAVVLLGGD